MWKSDSLLKLVELPFSYSLLIIPISNTLVNPENNLSVTLVLPFFLLFGFLGTSLAIIDPVGRLIRTLASNYNWLDYQEKNKDHPDFDYIDEEILKKLKAKFTRHAVNTNSVSYETDKVIGQIYFMAVLLIFSIVFLSFHDGVLIFSNVLSCDECSNSLMIIGGVLIITTVIIGSVVFFNMKKLHKKIRTTSLYLMAIELGHSEDSSIIKTLKFIEQNRWELAESWSHDYTKKLDTKQWPFTYRWNN